MKKILCFALAIMMIFSVIAVSATATEIENAETDASNAIYFDANTTGWANYNKIFCHIWVYGGDSFFAWQAKKEACTDSDGDGIWEYDLDAKGVALEDDALYAVIFSNENGMQTFNLLFDKTVVGDTAYCDAQLSYENPEDSSKSTISAFWKGQDPAVFGPEKCITSIGNVVGTCIPSTTSGQEMFANFLVNTLENARTFSGKTDQQILDDVAVALEISKDDIAEAIYATGVSVDWSENKSTAADGDSDDRPVDDEKPTDTPADKPTEIPGPCTDGDVDPEPDEDEDPDTDVDTDNGVYVEVTNDILAEESVRYEVEYGKTYTYRVAAKSDLDLYRFSSLIFFDEEGLEYVGYDSQLKSFDGCGAPDIDEHSFNFVYENPTIGKANQTPEKVKKGTLLVDVTFKVTAKVGTYRIEALNLGVAGNVDRVLDERDFDIQFLADVDAIESTVSQATPPAATPNNSASGNQQTTTNNAAIKTGTTAITITFITVLLMAAGIVMYTRKRKFN